MAGGRQCINIAEIAFGSISKSHYHSLIVGGEEIFHVFSDPIICIKHMTKLGKASANCKPKL